MDRIGNASRTCRDNARADNAPYAFPPPLCRGGGKAKLHIKLFYHAYIHLSQNLSC
jgi:hypothetical protein